MPTGWKFTRCCLDGCFQVMAEARSGAVGDDGVAYLPFGWERLWLTGPLPDQMVCHARLRDDFEAEPEEGRAREILTGDLVFCDQNGAVVGGLSGYSVKRATRAALLSASGGLHDLLYESRLAGPPPGAGDAACGFLPHPVEHRRSLRAVLPVLGGRGRRSREPSRVSVRP